MQGNDQIRQQNVLVPQFLIRLQQLFIWYHHDFGNTNAKAAWGHYAGVIVRHYIGDMEPYRIGICTEWAETGKMALLQYAESELFARR